MKILNACPFNLSRDKIRVLWEITPRCNMNCKHCLFFGVNEKGIQQELTTSQVYDIIDNLSQEKKLNAIWLSGGEPLLRNDIVDICRRISKKGIKPSLSTNSVLLTPKLIRDLHEAGVDYIHLSLDGSTAHTHDSLRGVPGAFDKLMISMDLLKNSPIKTGASFMVTEESIDEIEDVLEIAKDKNLSVLSFYLVAELGRGATNFKEDKTNLAKRLNEKVKLLQLRNNINSPKIEVFRADTCESEEDVLQECLGDHFLNITYDGKLGACPWLMKSKEGFTVGSLLDKDFIELEKICQNEMRRKIEKRREKLSFCEECTKKEQCGRGCMALQIETNGLYSELDPICPELNKNFPRTQKSSKLSTACM